MKIEQNILENHTNDQSRWIASPFWVGFWIVIVIGIFGYGVLPLMAPHLFENGITTLLIDPHFFHKLGVELAQKPWGEFTFHPQGQFPGGILGFIYKLTRIHHPAVLVPVLAVLAGLTMRAIAACLDVLGVKGRWWPLFIGIILSITPTSASWMIYPHKDSYIVPGVIIIAWAFMAVAIRRFRVKHILALVVGSALVFTSKPYFAEVFFGGVLLTLPFVFRNYESNSKRFHRVLFFLSGLVLFGLIGFTSKGYIEAGETYAEDNATIVESTNEVARHQLTKQNWQPLPGGKVINKPLLALVYTREKYLYKRSHGLTNYLPEIHIESGWDAIKFIPRALQLTLLEPLPWTMNEGGMARKVLFMLVKFEMLFVYAALLFLLFSQKKKWSSAVYISLAFSLPMLIALGFVAPNIGTANRYRFPFLILVKIAGFAALWCSDRTKWPGRLLMWIDPPKIERSKKKLLFLVPDDATFVIQRLVMAQGAQKAGYDVHVACPNEGHAQKIKDLGFTFHQLDLNRGGLNPFADFMPFVRLVFFLAKERPDILQCVSIKPVIYGATAGTIVGLKKIVCLVNGLGYAFEGTNLKGKIVKFIAKALYRNAFALPGIRVIFQNPDDRDYFVKEQLVTKEKTIIIRGSGVNMQKFAPTPQPQNAKPIILFVGRLLWSKGVRELVEAAKTLKAEGLNFELQIIGAPDDRNPEAVPTSYLKEQQELGVVNWLGRQTDMPHFFREADIVALPTVYNEGLPLTLLEAASTGRTLISTDAQGCREIVRHNVNGYLIPPHGVKELTDHLRTLIQNPDLRKKFGETSTKIVSEEFSAEIVQQQLLAVYHSLLNDSVHPAFQSVTSN